MSDLVAAVLLSFMAIESFANQAVDLLPDDAAVDIERRGERAEIGKDEMVRQLSTADKLELAVPLLDEGRVTKGTAAWERFVHLRRLRDDLVHVKAGGYSSDPEHPSAYGKLMLGAGDGCVEEAVVLITAAYPGFLDARALHALGVH